MLTLQQNGLVSLTHVGAVHESTEIKMFFYGYASLQDGLIDSCRASAYKHLPKSVVEDMKDHLNYSKSQ